MICIRSTEQALQYLMWSVYHTTPHYTTVLSTLARPWDLCHVDLAEPGAQDGGS